MKILIVTPFYKPDLGPSAPLFHLLSRGLVEQGHEVTVIAAVPHYPNGFVDEPYRKGFIQRSVEDDVNVIRIRVPSVDRSRLLMRALQFTTYQVGASVASLGVNCDIALVTNPALETWLPFVVNVILRNKPAIFSVHDLYPHVGVSLGIFHHKFVIDTVAWLEKFCLRHSKVVRILTESFRPGMWELGVPDDKIVLLYDWVDTDLIQPLSRRNGFAREHGLEDKFVVMYAGNIGLSQGLENLLGAAQKLSDHEDIHFALVGEGAAKANLMKEVEEKGLKNVTFIPFQPRERLPEVLSTANLSMVMLRCGVGVTALPSKTYSILASGRPMLASVDRDCETADLVIQSGAGVCVEPEDVDAIVEKILYLKDNPELCRQMGENGRIWAEKNHSPKSAARDIEIFSGMALAKRVSSSVEG